MSFFDFGEVIQQDTEFVIFGIPWDYLTSIDIANSSVAPKKIREVTQYLALMTEMGIEIPKLKVVDAGDVQIRREDIEGNMQAIKTFIIKLYEQKKDIIPVMIGGDHFCSFPVFKTIGDLHENKKGLGILLFDSHLDLYQEWDKGVYSHATISHRIFDLEYINNRNMLIAGTRDMDVPEMKIANNEGIVHFDAFLFDDLGRKEITKKIIDFYRNSKISDLYVSIDIDVLDPSVAPATGYAIPGGLSYRDLWYILRDLTKNFNVMGFDVVEVSPNLDLPNNVTSNLTAKLIIEFISFISNRI
jgi:agmatinase